MSTPGTPGTPGDERDRSLRRTRWALAGVAVGGAVLATGAVAVLNGGGQASATPQAPPGPASGGQFRPGEATHVDRGEHDDDDDRGEHDDDRGGPRGLTQEQLRQLIERGRDQVQEFFGGGPSGGQQQSQQPQQQYRQPQQPQQQGGYAPQSRSRGS